MGNLEWLRKKLKLEVLIAVAGLALVVACTAGSGTGGTSNERLVELQSGLATGHAAEWYTQRLGELGYEVATLRYDASQRLEYRVEKGGDEFLVRVTFDPELETGSGIEIERPGERGTVADAPGPHPGAAPDPEAAPSPDPEPARETTREPAREPAREPEPQTTPEPAPGPEPERAPTASPTPAPEPRFVEVPAGTRVAVRLDDRLDSGESRAGDRFTMTATEAVRVAGVEAIPAGSLVHGVVAEAESARRPSTGGRLVLSAERIEARGESVPVEAVVTAETRELEGEGSIEEDLKEIAIGAGVGGVIGGLLGGGKGVLAGILIGAGGTFLATKGEQVELPPDTPLLVELRQDTRFPGPR